MRYVIIEEQYINTAPMFLVQRPRDIENAWSSESRFFLKYFNVFTFR